MLRAKDGGTAELPWDFVRSYGDPMYRPHVETVAAQGKEALGRRVRRLRAAAGLTQEPLADAAGIGRVTWVRIERGEQSPRYDTVTALAGALNRPLRDLLIDN